MNAFKYLIDPENTYVITYGEDHKIEVTGQQIADFLARPLILDAILSDAKDKEEQL